MLTGHVPDPPPASDSVAPASIAEMARQCAAHRNPSPLFKNQILARVRDSETRLEAVHQSLAEAARLDHTFTASAEWLLDNAYLTRTGIAEIRRSLPRNHIRIHARQYGYLCVSELAAELVRYSDQLLDENNISQGPHGISKVDRAFHRRVVVVPAVAATVSDRIARCSRPARRPRPADSRSRLFLGESLSRQPAAIRTLTSSCD